MQIAHQNQSRSGFLKKSFFGIMVLSASVSAGVWGLKQLTAQPELPPELKETEQVHKVRFEQYVNAPGEIQSANNTVVECQIENIQVRVMGNSISAGASTRILSIIPDGTRVKKGDILCKLD
ncbi:MAG: hypothetical protein ACKO0V_09455, partial [bacterium]